MTIHITPEPQFSYVSFESNIPAPSYLNIVTNILNTFNPGKFILTIFATKVKCLITQTMFANFPVVPDVRGCSISPRIKSVR